jgi:MoxR-like ATPase
MTDRTDAPTAVSPAERPALTPADGEAVRQVAQRVHDLKEGVFAEVARVVVGMEAVTEQLLIALLAAGHVLIEGVPGVAKTTLSKAFARIVGGQYQRIQFTPDLLPSDVTGTYVFDRKANEFVLRQGPIFCQVLLADEVNRAPAKTQSALLEAMQEFQATIEGTTLPLPQPFLVLATQNPVEQEGVYALPEAQLDRFSMMLRVDYPTAADEVTMLHARPSAHVEPRVSPSDVAHLRLFIRDTVHVDDKILEYIVRLGRATRAPGDVGLAELGDMLVLGVSPRSYQHVLALARVTAFLHGRAYVLPEDVKEIYPDATRHRIARSVRAQAENVEADHILQELLKAVPIP